MKSIVIASALVFGAAPCFAGPYAVMENNGGFVGSDFQGSVTDFHIGYEGSGDGKSFYVEGGPSLVAPDGGETKTVLTGKAGGSLEVAEKLTAYGELSVMFDDTNSYGTKAGLKYSF
jgi:hypothetical protein